MSVCFVVLATGFAGALGADGDRPLQIIQTTEVRLADPDNPEIPSSGEVRVMVLVSDTGELKDLMLIGSTHRAFTEAAVTHLQQWRFEPAHENGRPVGMRTTVRIFFGSRGRVVSVRGGDVLPGLAGALFAPEFRSRLVEPAALDQPLQALETVSPGFPAQLSGRLKTRVSVVVDFMIDETGRTRMPVIVASDHPLLSVVAIEAIDHWRFTPPTRDRQPVVVRAKQKFVFFDSRLEASTAEPTTTPASPETPAP